jgi:hypothetical protein
MTDRERHCDRLRAKALRLVDEQHRRVLENAMRCCGIDYDLDMLTEEIAQARLQAEAVIDGLIERAVAELEAPRTPTIVH